MTTPVSLFTIKSITQHFTTRAEVMLTMEGTPNVRSIQEAIKISLTLEEAAELRVGSTYSLQFIICNLEVPPS